MFLWQHQSFPQSRNGFKVGMKLEGLDPCHPSLFCVLSVAEVRTRRANDSVCSLFQWNDMRAVSLCPVRSRVTGWGSILMVTQNATTSGQTPTRGTWNRLAGARRTGISYCCLKVKNKRTRNVLVVSQQASSPSAFFLDCKDGEFNWSMYVKNCRGQLAPKHLFKSLNTVRPQHRPSSAQIPGQRLEFSLFSSYFSLSRHLGSERGWSWRRWTERTRPWSA